MIPQRRDERGATTTIALVWTFPLVLVLMFCVVQAALWQHSNSVAIAAAQRGAADVARLHLNTTETRQHAIATLDRDHLANIEIRISTRTGVVTVTVAADAPGIVLGTKVRVHATATEPIEGWRGP